MSENAVVVGDQVDIFQLLPQKFTKSNYLIKSKYKMTATEHKVYNLSFIKVKYNEKENRPIAEIYADEILEITGRNKNNWVYKEMKEMAKRLSGSKKILIEDEINKRYKAMVLIGVAEYIDGEGKLIVKFEPDAKDLVLNLSNEISELYTIPYKKIKNYHSLIMYEMFQSIMFEEKRNGRNEFSVTYTMDELKYNLCMIELTESCESNLTKGKISLSEAIEISVEESTEFDTHQSFKRALNKAVKDVNQHTNLDVTCKSVRKGRGGKLSGYRFIVKEKEEKITDENVIKTDDAEVIDVVKKDKISEDELFKMIDDLRDIISEKLKMSDYKLLLEEADYDLEKIKSKYTLAKESKSKITNLMGWLRSAIKNDYSESIVKEPEKQIQDKPKGLHFAGERQRTPEEWDELEKMLLNR